MDLATDVLQGLAAETPAPETPVPGEPPPEAPVEEEAPAEEEAPEEEAPEEEEPVEEGEEEEEEETEEEPEVALADDGQSFKLDDDEMLTVAEARERLKDEGQRWKDYTRKTQAIAEERREFEQKAQEHQAEKDDLREWFQANRDPDKLEAQIREWWPEALETLIDRHVQARTEEADMTEREAALQRENRAHRTARTAATLKSEREKAQAGRDEEKGKREAENEAQLARQKNYATWVPGALREVGLLAEDADPGPDLLNMLGAQLRTIATPAEEWTEEHMKEAAKAMAQTVKRLTGKAPSAGGAKKKKPAVKPPPSTRGTGRGAVGSPKARKKKDQPVEMDKFFGNLRLI